MRADQEKPFLRLQRTRHCVYFYYGATVTPNSGEGGAVSDSERDTRPSDGLGRRPTQTGAHADKYATVSGFSIISLISNHDALGESQKQEWCSVH